MSLNLLQLRRDESGNVAILFALMMLPIMGGVGIAVDHARAHRLQTQLQIVADAATSAGLNEYRLTGDVNKGQERLLAYIDDGLEKDGMVRAREENGNGANAGEARVVYVDGSVIDPATSTVRPVLRSSITTPFMSLLGTEELDIEVYTKGGVASNSEEGTKDLEVSMMLDVSGSMDWDDDGGDRKMDSMKAAAQDFLDIIMPQDLAVQNRRVGLVPFSDRVNVGSYAAAATGYDATIQVPDGTTTTYTLSTSSFSWMSLTNCRNRVQDATQYANYSNTQAQNHCKNNFQKSGNNYRTPALVTVNTPKYATRYLRTCVTERQGDDRYTDAAPGSGKYVGVYAPGYNNNTNYSSSQNNCDLPVIKTLTTDKEMLKTHIQSFGTYGATAGHVGTAWSAYMLSPEWNRFWSSGHLDTAEYNNTNVIKAAVLMTDGQYNSNWANIDSSTQAIGLCNEMKAKGIIVYTIGFDMSTNDNDPARQTLISCASPGKYYFPYDGDALREAFEEIGDSLVTIVTKSSDDETVLISE